MSDHEQEIIERMSRSSADRAEVLSQAVRQNMRFGEMEMIALVMQDIACVAWGVAAGDEDPAVLAEAATGALAKLDAQAWSGTERVMLRQVVQSATREAQMERVPGDALVTGAECLAAHMADLETECEGGEV